jgi:hypothetical protein
LIAVSGVAWFLARGKSEANATTAVQPSAARVDRVDGSVAIARAEDGVRQPDWTEATVNTPVTVGDRVFVRDRSRASIALTGHDYIQLNPATSLDLLSLEARRTQLALRSGSGLFDVGELSSGELYEVATPCGAVDFEQPGLYQVGIDGGNAIVSVLSGLAQVVGQGGTGTISKGQVFTLVGAASTQALASSLAPDLAGNIVDGYYRTRYPRSYDGRYRNYDTYLADPYSYDPYRGSLSCRYLPADVPGVYDLDDYGDWVDVMDYGHCWAPRVSAGWAPFQSGYWYADDVWGPSWVSSEAWGWAPYHYGRWCFVNERWLWVPVEVGARPAYCPAPVAFIPLAGQIAWVPLGPGEVYVQRYYDVNFRPRYLASAQVINVVNVQRTFINFNAPGGVTVVPMRAFARLIDPTVITPIDAGVVARSRAVLDPFSIEGIRQLAVNREDARRRIRFSRNEQVASNASVVATVVPPASPVRADLRTALNVQAVPATRKANKLKISESGQVTGFRRADGLPQPLGQSRQQSQMAALAARVEQGDRSARREMRQLMREEMRAPQQQPQSVGQTQQEQSRQQMKQQRRADSQQQAAALVQQDQTRRVQREQMRQQQQQQVFRQEQTRQQRMEQRRLERRPPEASVRQPQPRQFEQPRSQRAQQAAAVQAQALQREQIKAQRHIEQQQRQAVMQPQSVQPGQHQAAQRPVYQNPAAQQNASPQSQRKVEKAQRRSSQF